MKRKNYTVKMDPTERKDPLIKEFLTRDLGHDIRNSGSAVVIRPKNRLLPTSIALPPDLVEKLKTKAAKRGIGYQTMLKIIVHEHVDDY